MKAAKKRIFALILTVIMMVTMLPSGVYAVETDGVYEEKELEEVRTESEMETENDTAAENETADEGEEESPAAEDPEEADPGQLPDDPKALSPEAAGTDQPAGEALDGADPAEEETKNNEAEAPEEAENSGDAENSEEAASEEESGDEDAADRKDMLSLEIEEKEYIVTITYDETAGIPEDARILVEEVKADHELYNSYVEQAADVTNTDSDSLNYVKLLDISIVDSLGEKVEPAGPVDVQIRLKDVRKAEETTQVVHFAGEKEVPEVVETDVDGNTLAFAAEGFSVYAVISGQEYYRLIVNFYENAQAAAPLKTMYVKKKDLPVAGSEGEEAAETRFKEIIYDPGAPTPSAEDIGKEFRGWIQEGSSGEPMSIDEIRTYVKNRLQSVASDGETVNFYPVFTKIYRIFYKNENGAVFHTSSFTSDETAKVDQTYEPSTGAASFGYWYNEEDDDPTASTTEHYTVGSTIELSADVVLVPYIRPGHWLEFDGNGQGTQYTVPTYYLNNDIPVKPADPQRKGYEFAGWYDQPEGGTKYNWAANAPLTQDLKLYAHWNLGTADYTVIINIQNIENKYTDTQKDYVYEAAIRLTATTGTEINSAFIDALTASNEVTKYTVAEDLKTGTNGSQAYELAGYTVVDGSGNPCTTVRGTGDTVINLNYDRKLFTLKLAESYVYKSINNYDSTSHMRDSFARLNDDTYLPLEVDERQGLFNNENWYYYFDIDNNRMRYTGTRWYISSTTYKEYKGLYGQPIEWPLSENSAYYYRGLIYLEAFVGNLFSNNTYTVDAYQQPNTTIYFWNEDVNGSFEKVTTRYRVNKEKNCNITNRFEGLEVTYYLWTDANVINMPAVEDCYGLSDTSVDSSTGSRFTNVTRPATTYANLHIINLRKRSSIIWNYVDNHGAVQEIKRIGDIPYEKALSGYVSDIPTQAEVNAALPGGYYFAEGGWYLDQNCTQAADLSQMEMGLADIPIYAKIEPYEIHIRLYKNGGINNSLDDNFWGDHGELLDEGTFMAMTERENHSLVGWYKDKDFNTKWNFNTPLAASADVISYLYQDSADEEDPFRLGYPEGDAYPANRTDHNYPFTVGVLTLYARWRDESGGYVIRYTGNGGTYQDSYRHSEGSEFVLADFGDTTLTCPENKRFDGWTLKGKTYKAGDTLTADEALANAETETVAGRVVHVITFAAAYADQEDRTPTHINWYYNYAGAPSKYFHQDVDKGINETVAVPGTNAEGEIDPAGPGIPVRDGYNFLGWARDVEDDDTGLSDVQTLFIAYDKETGYAFTQVAADELPPYQALYAVWQEQITFDIIHTDGDRETISWTEDTPYDLTAKVKGDCLYGGYRTSAEGKLETASGKEVKPVNGSVYYLREVSNNYLKPQVYITYYANYNEKKITGTYALVNVDDANSDPENPTYNEIGISVYHSRTNSELEDKSTNKTLDSLHDKIYLKREGQEPEEITNKGLFGDYFEGTSHPCYTGLVNLGMDYNYAGDTLEIRTYFVTRDNVRVPGRKLRMVRFGDGCFSGSWAWSNNKGIGSGVKSVSPYTLEAAGSSGTDTESSTASGYARPRNAGAFMIQAPGEEKKKHTITKISGSETTTQEVEEGDRTGQILYAEKDGYMFAGWYTDKAFKNPADFSSVTADMEVYARYISQDNITLTLGRSANLIGSVPFDAAVSVKSSALPDDIEVSCVKGAGTFVGSLDTTKKVNVGTKKKPVYAYKHQGTVTIANVGLYETFTAQVIWTTPDGTRVEGKTYTVSYSLGKVTLQ